MEAPGNGRFRFGKFEFDRHSRALFRDGWPVKIQPQPLRVLAALLEHPGEIVSREELRRTVWGESTFVEFDEGLNYSVRQIRLALSDKATKPTYIETLPKQGYRFIGHVQASERSAHEEMAPDASNLRPGPVMQERGKATTPTRAGDLAATRMERWRGWLIPAGLLLSLALAASMYLVRLPHRSPAPRYTQLTDFTDSAMAPALSPDGRMVAFFRGNATFMTGDPIYIKVLPNGSAKCLTDDKRPKYGLAFSPDGSQVAYTVLDAGFATYTVSVFGGESHLLLNNAAGLSWLDKDQLLFSQFRSGIHLGVVTGTASRGHFRELYFPPSERGMAHYSFASPDRKSALVVEMNGEGDWDTCRLISLKGPFAPRAVGPAGACTSAAWSPSGVWMYFIADVEGQSHLWRARFPSGKPEQITFGPTEEFGVAPEPDGESVITSMGVHESTVWVHDSGSDRALFSEGETMPWPFPSFSADGKLLYYLWRDHSSDSEFELWRTDIPTGQSEPVFPGTSMHSYSVSPDNRRVLYTTVARDGTTQLWITSMNKSSPARRIGSPGDRQPSFGPHGKVLFEFTEGERNFIGQMNQDGSGRSKAVSYPISDLHGMSPGRRWIMADAPLPTGKEAPVAIPVDGGSPRPICATYCVPVWALDDRSLFVPVEAPSSTRPGRSLMIPTGPDEDLSALPAEGIKAGAQPTDVPGSISIGRAYFVPGKDLSHYAYVKTAMHFNLFRIQLP